jgi:hypothetical protein
MNDQFSDDPLDRTIEACAWLIDVAQQSVDSYGWDPVIVRYLEHLGQTTYQAKTLQDGGMGAMAHMWTQ